MKWFETIMMYFLSHFNLSSFPDFKNHFHVVVHYNVFTPNTYTWSYVIHKVDIIMLEIIVMLVVSQIWKNINS